MVSLFTTASAPTPHPAPTTAEVLPVALSLSPSSLTPAGPEPTKPAEASRSTAGEPASDRVVCVTVRVLSQDARRFGESWDRTRPATVLARPSFGVAGSGRCGGGQGAPWATQSRTVFSSAAVSEPVLGIAVPEQAGLAMVA